MPRRKTRESKRTWIAGLSVTAMTVVAYMAFWFIAPQTTFAIGCTALVALVVAAWWYGRLLRMDQELEKELSQPTAHDA